MVEAFILNHYQYFTNYPIVDVIALEYQDVFGEVQQFGWIAFKNSQLMVIGTSF